jgi:molybdenum cofactor cytidylyltransferase
MRIKRVSGIVLAAGLSSRMGEINKLTLSINGTPLLIHTLKQLLKSNLHEIVVVIGYEQEMVRSLISKLPVRLVYNENYLEGQMTSVHCGLSALHDACDGVMICLSDLPLLQPCDINQLINAFLNQCETSIMVPTYQGQRGNPIVMDFKHRQDILENGRNLGCKRLLEKNPDMVTVLKMKNDHTVFDLDTTDDYLRVLNRIVVEQSSVQSEITAR